MHRRARWPFFSLTLVSATAWLLRNAARDYANHGRLSSEASAVGWTLYLLHATATLSSARRPSLKLPVNATLSVAAGRLLMLLGSALYMASVRRFASIGQVSGRRPGGLVTSGPYRFSRNPHIVGCGLVLGGAALARRSAKALLLVVGFFLAHQWPMALAGPPRGHENRAVSLPPTSALLGAAKARTPV